jgi:hypothetical protein
MESVQGSVACVGLLYDQLAAVVCSCSKLDISFLVRHTFCSLLVIIWDSVADYNFFAGIWLQFV